MSTDVKDGGPAFPRDHAHHGHNGMTLRDYFAAMATEKDVNGHIQQYSTSGPPKRRSREQAKYAYADAMLRARENTNDR